jgi:hypothetical protein
MPFYSDSVTGTPSTPPGQDWSGLGWKSSLAYADIHPGSTIQPSFYISMSKTIYSAGDTLTATDFGIRNPGLASPVHLRVWLELPDGTEVDLIRIGPGSSLSLPAGIDRNLGPIDLTSVSANFPPRGRWELNSRITHPVTNAVLGEDLNSFTIQ